jgi:hypothetical protein
MLLVLNGVLLLLDHFTVIDAQMQFSLGAIWFPDSYMADTVMSFIHSLTDFFMVVIK